MNKFPVETLEVPELVQRERLLEWAIGKFTTATTRNGIKKSIKKGLLRINGELVNSATFVYGGEKITLYRMETSKSKPQIELDLEVLYEDDELAIVHKPAGILVSGNKKWTLENALSNNLQASAKPDALIHPEPIHRLDYPTSGALLIGKTMSIVVKLNKMFENREIKKNYYAVTIGGVVQSGVIDLQVGEKPAKTSFEVIDSVDSKRFGKLNLIKLQPETGRKHQIRVHLSKISSPILGDSKYGKEGLILKGKGLYLHAYSLAFLHPSTRERLLVKSSLPKKFRKIFEI